MRCRSRRGSSQQTPPFVTPGRHSCNQLAHPSQQLPALLCLCETSGVSTGMPQAHHECSSTTFSNSCYFGEDEGAAVASRTHNLFRKGKKIQGASGSLQACTDDMTHLQVPCDSFIMPPLALGSREDSFARKDPGRGRSSSKACLGQKPAASAEGSTKLSSQALSLKLYSNKRLNA